MTAKLVDILLINNGRYVATQVKKVPGEDTVELRVKLEDVAGDQLEIAVVPCTSAQLKHREYWTYEAAQAAGLQMIDLKLPYVARARDLGAVPQVSQV